MSYSYMIGDYLQRFEITTSYTSSFAYDLDLVKCDPEHIFYFKKFCDHLNNGAILRPYRYYLAHNMTGACQLEYYQNDSKESEENIYSRNDFTFRLFYVFPYNKTHDVIRVYNESTDFRNWDFRTEGQFVEFVNSSTSVINFSPEIVLKEPYWTTGIAAIGSQNESRVFTIVYPILGNYNETEFEYIHNDDTINLNFHKVQKNTTKIGLKNQHLYTKNNFNVKTEAKRFDNKNIFLNDHMASSNFKEKSFFEKNNLINDIRSPQSQKIDTYWFAHSIDEAKEKNTQINSNYLHKTRKDVSDDKNKIVITSVASSFFTESLYFILKQRTQAKHSRFIVTDYTYSVLIDNEVGAIYPKYFNEKNMSIFPNISDINSSLWRSVEKEIIEVPIDIPLLINVSSTEQYMIMKRIIDTRSRYSFYLIMLLELNPTITEIYSSLTKVFILCLTMSFFVLFLLRLSLFFINNRKMRKLKIKQEHLIVSNFNISNMKYDNISNNDCRTKKIKNNDNVTTNNIQNSGNNGIFGDNEENKKEITLQTITDNNFHGTVMDTIENLRMIQLKNSENISLNNMIDTAIEEMTRNQDELFNIEFSIESCNSNSSHYKSKDKNIKAKSDSTLAFFCPFCSYLIENNSDFSILKNNDIKLRKSNEKEKLKTDKILNNILNEKISDNKTHKNNYYYDPKEKGHGKLFTIWNLKINMILNHFIEDDLLNTNPHKYLIRMFMKFIQKENFLFNDFYPDLLMSFLLSFTKDNIFCFHCKIQSFGFLKKLMKHNFEFWLKSKIDIFTLFLASILRNSKIHETDQIITSFQSSIGYHNVYFLKLLKTLIDKTTNINVMELYGTLLNRTLSPNFSVSNNTKDAVLFMKAILVFSDFAPYLTSAKQNEKCFIEINECIFSNEEKENPKFVSNFHLEMSKNVVAPWVNLMSSIAPMKEIKDTLLENISNWVEDIQSENVKK